MYTDFNISNLFGGLGSIGIIISAIIKCIMLFIPCIVIGYFISNYILFISILTNKIKKIRKFVIKKIQSFINE